MRIDRRLTIIGIMLIVLSMTMATQYATTRVGYEYNIVHPSNADIRFIASDNSTDNITVLRVTGANGTNAQIKLHIGGNFSSGTNKTYTACFAIVNEEVFKVNITNVNVSIGGGMADYMQIWLHKNRTKLAGSETGYGAPVMLWDKGTAKKSGSTQGAWILGAGNTEPSNMNGTRSRTNWTDHNVRFSKYNGQAVNGTSDFVWVQISIDLPLAPAEGGAHTGSIYFHFEANRNGFGPQGE
jgi:hypothetical protein